MPRSRRQRVVRLRDTLRGSSTAALVVVVLALALGLVGTSWGKEQLRRGILQQARPYLSADLQISRIGRIASSPASRSRGPSRTASGISSASNESKFNACRRLFRNGTAIRKIVVVSPRISAERMSDGRWDLASVVHRPSPPPRTGPRQPLHLPTSKSATATLNCGARCRSGPHAPAHFRVAQRSIRLRRRWDGLEGRSDQAILVRQRSLT